MKIDSKLIALSGISTAFALIFVLGGIYIPNLTLTFYVLSALSISLPLMKERLLGAILAYIASSLLAFLLASLQSIPFIIFFGLYTLVLWVLDFKFYNLEKLSKYAKIAIIAIIKIAYYTAAFFACFYLMKLTVLDFTMFNIKWTMPMLFIAGFIVFSLYDFGFRNVFIVAKREFLKRIKF